MKVKECVNSKCKNTFYVDISKLALPIQCKNCINKKE